MMKTIIVIYDLIIFFGLLMRFVLIFVENDLIDAWLNFAIGAALVYVFLEILRDLKR